MANLSGPCRSCEGTRKACRMNCGKSSTDQRSRKQCLQECVDCDTCHCRWKRMASLESAMVQAIEEMPDGYRLTIDLQRDDGHVTVYAPRAHHIIEGDGYLAEDVRAAIEWAKKHATRLANPRLKQWRKI